MRDFRINRIFEGSSEIMHLFMAREAVDRHLQVAGAMIDPEKGSAAKLAALPGMAAFYAWWYPTRWLGWGRWPRYADSAGWPRTCASSSAARRKLARQSFHGMLRYQARLQNKQAFLFRLVDVANELFAMAASVCRAQAMADDGAAQAAEARGAGRPLLPHRPPPRGAPVRGPLEQRRRREVPRGLDVLGGRHAWLERGILGLEGAMDGEGGATAGAPEQPVGVSSAR